MRFIQKLKVKNDLKKIEKELKNVKICMLYWSHGEMGFTQSNEEIEELEKQECDLIEKRNACYNNLIMWKVADRLNAKSQENRDRVNKDFDDLVYIRDHP